VFEGSGLGVDLAISVFPHKKEVEDVLCSSGTPSLRTWGEAVYLKTRALSFSLNIKKTIIIDKKQFMFYFMFMPEMDPYHFYDEELHSSVKPHLVRTDLIEHKGIEYEYGVISQDAAPDIPNFVGMPNGQNLFISEGTPPDLAPFFLKHEIECNRLRFGEIGRCQSIEAELLDGAPPEISERLLQARLDMFEAIAVKYDINPDSPPEEEGIPREIAGTLAYLRQQSQA